MIEDVSCSFRVGLEPISTWSHRAKKQIDVSLYVLGRVYKEQFTLTMHLAFFFVALCAFVRKSCFSSSSNPSGAAGH